MTDRAPGATEATPPTRQSLVGRTLQGTYRILKSLDHGGMGFVFAAEHVRLKRRVAVKVLAQHLAADENALGRFHREAEIISQLDHPNIVHVLDFDTTEEGEPYIVMELLAGESLADRLDREHALPLSDVVRLTSQIAAGLGYAHRASVVHRDLKPANIFLVHVADQGNYVKLLDFGISKSAVGGGRKITQEFDILGTPDYMAPEQARGQTKNVDHRADQYSLAAIAYEMLTGVVPFPGDDVMTVLQKVVTEEPRAMSEIASHIPAALDKVIQRALAKHPDHRYANVIEFAQQLALAAGWSLPSPAKSGRPEAEAPGAKASSVAPAIARAEVSTAQSSDAPPVLPSPPLVSPTSATERANEQATTTPAPLSRRASEMAKTEYAARRDNQTSDAPPISRREVRSGLLPPEPAPSPAIAHEPRTDPRNSPQFDAERSDRSSQQGSDPSLSHDRSSGIGDRLSPIADRPSSPDKTPSTQPSPGAAPATTPPAGAGRRYRPVSSPHLDPVGEVRHAIAQARQALGFEDIELAANYAEAALAMADRSKAPALGELVSDAATLFTIVFERRLGNPQRPITVRDLQKSDSQESLSPEHMFLLTRLDSASTVEEAIDLSPLPRLQTLRVLVSLARRRLITLR
jgi:serine/threonine protein kinase